MYADALQRGLLLSYIEHWNNLPANHAAEDVLPCCGSQAWAHGLAVRRPLQTLPELLAASDTAWWSLPEADWDEAFRSHPRIGERHSPGVATAASLQWSAGEQGKAMLGEERLKADIAQGNREYEELFGRTFIICASGKSSQEILQHLRRRLGNTDEIELREAAEQQREITHIRLQKWLTEREKVQH